MESNTIDFLRRCQVRNTIGDIACFFHKRALFIVLLIILYIYVLYRIILYLYMYFCFQFSNFLFLLYLQDQDGGYGGGPGQASKWFKTYLTILEIIFCCAFYNS